MYMYIYIYIYVYIYTPTYICTHIFATLQFCSVVRSHGKIVVRTVQQAIKASIDQPLQKTIEVQ